MMKWLSILAAIALITCCFFPWIVVTGKSIIISGIDASNTNYGRPGYINLVLSILYIFLMLIPRIWARRCNLGVAAINTAWTFRNYLILTRCEMGDCPPVMDAFYIYIISSILMLAGALLTDTGKKIY
jgi:hypothetical protein